VGNPVHLLLAAIGAAAVLGLGFVGVAPNRILSPVGLPLWQAAPAAFLAAIGIGGALMAAAGLTRSARPATIAGLLGSALLFLAAFAAAGSAAAGLAAGSGPLARVSLGGAFWLLVIAGFLGIGESLRRSAASGGLRIAFGFVVLAILAVMAGHGAFDRLSLVREWAGRRDAYSVALADHLRLVVAAVILATAIGVPLGLRAATDPRFSRRVFAFLSFAQTIPSIALFGLLIGPLTALSTAAPFLRDLGIRGIGFAPALIALVLYGLLPIARSTETGIRGVPAAAVDAATGMGMTRRQILFRVALPLALPALVAGMRILTVQVIGLTVVAALIGAGGFGSFVFIGLGQTANDLVLLGALSAILLALIADAGLGALAVAARRIAAP